MSVPASASGFRGFLKKFTSLRATPRELWIVYVAYIFENLAYKVGAAGVLTLWLSADLHLGDESAGAMVAVWSAIMTLITVLVGSLTDALGIRKTFLLGFWICLVSRLVMTVTANPWVVIPFGLYLQAAGIALLIPVMAAACKRYTNAAQRSVAFALYYALMNFGFAIGDVLFDKVRAAATRASADGVEHTAHLWTFTWHSLQQCPYQMLIALGVVFTVPGLILVWFWMREGVEMTEAGVRIQPPPAAAGGTGLFGPLWQGARNAGRETFRIFAGLWRQQAFYRFLLFMTLVVGVKMIFYHLAYTFPKYAIRELGDGAPFAHLSGMMNSLMIVVLVPICGALTQKVSAYRMVTFGSLVSALSVFFIAVPPQWFQPLADGWFGKLIVQDWLKVAGPVNPLWMGIFLFIFFLSIGEAFWSPRLYEYAAAIAPKGQEASYMALSMLPYFVAKFTVGLSSGWLLAWYCPADGPRQSEIMWLIIGGMALVTPLGTFLFRRHLQLQEAGREPVEQAVQDAAREEEAGHG